MPYVCRNCDYFDSEGAHAKSCPSCGGGMRFTMLNPGTAATATLNSAGGRPAWKNPYANGFDEIEAPWEFRYAQIGIGISTYFFVFRWGPRLLSLLVGNVDKLPKETLMAYAIAILIVNCIGALAGGAASGFWARGWMIQGLGVAIGVLTIPIVGILFLAPKSWPLMIITLAATSVLTIVGAFLGHLIVKPTRIPRS